MLSENPWFSIWVRPRATIQSIIQENPNRSLWILAFIYGLTSLLNTFQSVPVGTLMGVIPMILVGLILAPFWGYLVFSIWSWVIYIVGKMLKGQSTFKTSRAAYAWACVPLLGNIPLWILLVAFYHRVLFGADQAYLSNGAALFLFLLILGKLVFAIWSLVVYIQALAEVQQFSTLRSIFNILIAALIVALFLMGVMALIGSATQYATVDWHQARTIVELIK